VQLRIRAFIRNYWKENNVKESEKSKPDIKEILDEFDIKEKGHQFVKKALSDIPLVASLDHYSDEGGCYEEGEIEEHQLFESD